MMKKGKIVSERGGRERGEREKEEGEDIAYSQIKQVEKIELSIC